MCLCVYVCVLSSYSMNGYESQSVGLDGIQLSLTGLSESSDQLQTTLRNANKFREMSTAISAQLKDGRPFLSSEVSMGILTVKS